MVYFMKVILDRKKIAVVLIPLILCSAAVLLTLFVSKINALQTCLIGFMEKGLGRPLNHEHWKDFLSSSALHYVVKGCIAFLLIFFGFAALISYLHSKTNLKKINIFIIAGIPVAWLLYTGTSLAGLVIPAFLLLLFIFMYEKEGDFFEALLSTLIVYSLYVVLINNVLSFFSAVSFLPLLLVYIVPSIVLAWHIYRKGGYKKLMADLPVKFTPVWQENKFFIVAIIIVTSISLLGALFGQVENCDVACYHLARIAAWEKNHSINYYFTNVTRQLLYPVLAEYVALHFYILFGNDSLVNLIHWGLYCMSGLCIFRICRGFGIKTCWSFWGTLLFLTIPIAFAMSMVPMFHLVATFFLFAFLYYIQKILTSQSIRPDGIHIKQFALAATCFALGYLSKPSVCFPMAIILVYFAVALLKGQKLKPLFFVQFLGICSAVFVLIVSETMLRTLYYGNPDTTLPMSSYFVGNFSPKFLLINFVKNYTALISFGTGERLTGVCLLIARLLGCDINDPSISFYEGTFAVPAASYYADDAHAPFVTFAGTVAFFVLLYECARKKKFFNTFILLLFFASLSVPFILRYQGIGGRMMMASIPLLCVCIPYVCNLSVSEQARKGVSILLAAIVFVFFIPQVQFQDFSLSRGLPGLKAQFLEKNKRPEEAVSVMMGYLRKLNPSSIGIFGNEFCPVYPITARFKDSGVQISEIDVNGSENPLHLRNLAAWEKYTRTMVSEPDVIIADGVSLPLEFIYENNLYTFYNNERIPPFIYVKQSFLESTEGQ